MGVSLFRLHYDENIIEITCSICGQVFHATKRQINNPKTGEGKRMAGFYQYHQEQCGRRR